MTGGRHRRGDGVVVASLAVLVCVLGTLSGCQRAQSDADTPRQAVQGTWVLDHDVDTPEVPFVTFAADRSWVASDGCDRVYGTWRITASSRLTVVAGPHAELGCAGAAMVDAALTADTARVPRGTDQLRLRGDGSTLALDPSKASDVGPQDRPIGYWVRNHSSDSPYLSLRGPARTVTTRTSGRAPAVGSRGTRWRSPRRTARRRARSTGSSADPTPGRHVERAAVSRCAQAAAPACSGMG